MNLRRGCVFEENPREGTPLIQVKAHLPVAESFGFVSALRQQTSGQAFPQCVFDHWENMPGNAMEVGGKMQELVLAVRKLPQPRKLMLPKPRNLMRPSLLLNQLLKLTPLRPMLTPPRRKLPQPRKLMLPKPRNLMKPSLNQLLKPTPLRPMLTPPRRK